MSEQVQVQCFRPAGEPEHIYYLEERGRAVQMEARPTPRRHYVRTLESLAAFVRDHLEADRLLPIWYDRDGVMVYLDDEVRRDFVRLELVPSAEMRLLTEWQDCCTWMSRETLSKRLEAIFRSGVYEAKEGETIARMCFTVPAWEGTGRDIYTTVYCQIETDEDGDVAISPAPGSLAEAWMNAERDLGCAIRAALGEVPGWVALYCGVP